MAKKQLTDTGASSGPKPMSDRQRDHFKNLVAGTLDVAAYNAHGLAHGAQGRRGHAMPKGDADQQPGSYVPQAMGRDGGVGFNDDQTGADDYGKAGGDE
jgi:hypothetical protein